jgi:hypothetical protein
MGMERGLDRSNFYGGYNCGRMGNWGFVVGKCVFRVFEVGREGRLMRVRMVGWVWDDVR